MTIHDTAADIESADTPRFAPGTFAPAPGAGPRARMLAAQTRLEFLLIVRNGEQLLLTLLIPITILIGMTLLPIGDFDDPRVDRVLPLVLATAVMSTAFTGQAIAVGFDRRYGALKLLGATALPRWGVIAGKSAAVALVVLGQMVVLCAIALALGWRPTAVAVGVGIPLIVLGTVAFATMGLLIGGTFKAEIVLALANILWFVLLGLAGVLVLDPDGSGFLHGLVSVLPSGALTGGLLDAGDGAAAPWALLVLAVWALVCGAGAVRYFRFE